MIRITGERLRAFWTRALVLTATAVLLTGAYAIAKPIADAFTQTAKLVAPDGAAGDGYGYSVAISGDVAVAGAYRNDAVALDAGAAYVSVRDGAWSQDATLRPADLGADDRFGQAVAASGERIIVGSPRDDDLGLDTGAAYVFVRTAEGWQQEAKLLPAGGIDYGRAGQAVAIDGDTAAISGGRKVFVYVRTDTGWAQQTVLTSPTGVYDYFGCSIALSGDTLVSGAHGFQSTYDEGRAYVFARAGDAWSLQATLQAADGVSNDQFGFSVDVDGDTALVGAWGDDDLGLTCGAAYVFARAGEVWTQTAKIVPDTLQSYDYFGYFVSLDGGLAAVCADGDDDVAPDAGAAYVFDGASGWAQVAKLTASDGAEGDLFGNPSVSDGAVLVGAYGSDSLGTDAGAAYVFESGGSSTPGQSPGPGGPKTAKSGL